MANYNPRPIYIPNGPNGNDETEAKRRSSISAFSADMDTGRLSRYMSDDNGRLVASTTYASPNDALRAGFDGLEEQADIEAADNKRRKQATLSWAYGNAMRNGGNVRKEVMPAIRRELGREDLLGATVANDGNMMLIGQGKDGRPYPMGIVPAEDVLSAAMGSEDYDTADIVGGKLSKRLTPGQLQSLGWSKQATSDARQRKASDNLKLEALKILSDIDKANGKPIDAPTFYSKKPKLAEMFLQGYQSDSSGNIVKDPETGEGVVVTPEEAAKQALTFFNGLRSSQDQDNAASPIQNAVISAITQMLNPPTTTPTSKRKQVVYYYKNKNGGLTATNGFVVNGRAYDPDGNELRGVTPLDDEGNPMTGEAPNDAVVQTEHQSGAAAEIGKRKGNGTWGASSDKTAEEITPDSVQPQTPTDPPTLTPEAQQLADKMKGKGVKKGVTGSALSEEAARKKRKQDISNAGANESIAMHYDSILPSTKEKLRAAIPEMSNSDLYSGKYDKQILALAKRLGDESTSNVLSQIKMFRDEKVKNDVNADIQHIRDEAERLGIREGLTQEQIDEHAKRNIDRLYGNSASRITTMLNSPLR